MASEWEELEKLSKDELIIELVKERHARREMNRSLRMMIDWDYKIEGERSCEVEPDESIDSGSNTTDEWAKKILRYAKAHLKPEDYSFDEAEYGKSWKEFCDEQFDDCDTDEYGLEWEQAKRVFESMKKEGSI